MKQPPPTCLESAYGRIETDRDCYAPLDPVTVRVSGRPGDDRCRLRVCDPDQRLLAVYDLALVDGQAVVTFPAGGKPGAHYLYLVLPGETRNGGRWSRYRNYEVAAETEVHTGDPDFDDLYPFIRARMRLGRRAYDTPAGRFVGYISGDTWHFDGIWLRDWIYQVPAFRFWEREMTCGLDRFLERQREDGMVPDGIERDGHTWRVGLESDVEYILVMGVYGAWQATGDDDWLREALPRLEKALAYIQSDLKHWDVERGLIKRQHSCDTWDYDIDGASDRGEGRYVVATCDQSGYALAFRLMQAMYESLGQPDRAAAWGERAAQYRRAAAGLLWDGTKFLHHVHLDPIEHNGFNEAGQLAMGNTWAATRGLATSEQARAIVDEYRRRHLATGDRYPWWSLQPPYPDELGYWRDDFRQAGGYANGGLMPWVGGELCRAALQNGREAYGVALLRQYAGHLRETGGSHVWYFADGRPGFRTTNEVDYTGWGMAEWLNALVEGLAGVKDEASRFAAAKVSPRWAAAGVNQARVCASYAASEGYIAYDYHLGEALTLRVTGSGRQAHFHLLLPPGWQAPTAELDGHLLEAQLTREDESLYIDFTVSLEGVRVIRIVG